MKRHTWKLVRVVLVAAGLVGALISCNSHPLLVAGDPSVVVIDPPPVPPPPPPPIADAGLTNPFGKPAELAPPPDAATPSGDVPFIQPQGDAAVVTPAPDAKMPDLAPPGPDLAPPKEDPKCPSGYVRVHVRDIWSNAVDPSMKTMTAPPSGVLVIDSSNWATYGARQDAANCSYYSVCLATTVTKILIKGIGADSCPVGSQSGTFDLSSFKNATDVWIEYRGTSTTLQQDFTSATLGDNAFKVTSDPKTLKFPPCEVGVPPSQTIPDGYTKVHFRWPWNDPTNPKTPYPGSACPLDFATKMGFTVPPYPSSLKVTGLTCEMVAVLEFQDSTCPWYYVMIPDSAWPTTGPSKNIVFRYPDESKQLYTNGIALPPRSAATKEYWLAYAGAPDNTIASATKCMDWSLQTNSYFVYTSNPGPGYTNCGGSVTPPDPCSPLQPSGYHTVHFRYLWAGQKTFTFFPKPELMPKWMELEVNGPGNALKVICQREQDRPWYQCPVPDSAFSATTTWRAVDKLHSPEWNTVKPWPLPAEPKEYWIRWYYGKPDIPRSSDPPNFKVFDYYPDGSNGDWSATGVWNDDMCAPKPPAVPVSVGFGNGAWFPYKKTQYMYPYGGSLAFVYPDAGTVQDLFDAFVWERYHLWKKNWVRFDADACGTGTARVHSDIPTGTVSEGQGYGIAIAAAIGDKDLVTKLWEFVRHFRSQKKYCSLMGWIWTTAADCVQPADAPGKGDSAFDGDVDIAIGLVYAALQWPNEFTDIAVEWLKGMECEVNAKYGDGYNYPTNGDSWDKATCTADKCEYAPKTVNSTYIDYFPPGYFRVFGDFLAAKLGSDAKAANGQTYKDFWYKTAETVWELVERCYDVKGVHPGLMGNMGHIDVPCSSGGGEPYEWGRALWRLAIDAAWFGDNKDLPENKPNSSPHFGGKSRIQAKMDNIQEFYTNFYKKNPPEPNANRFAQICHQLGTDGAVANCDSAYGHNSYTVNLAMCPYATSFDNGGKTTSDIRREAIEEAISTTVQNDHYFQESLGVYSILFLTGNYPNPMVVPKN